MKKTLLLFAVLFTSVSTWAQSWTASETTSLKLECIGTTSQFQASVRATNKQSCPVNVKFRHNGIDRIKCIQPLMSDTFNIFLPECVALAKPLDDCGGADTSWIGVNVCIQLPIKFTSLVATRVDPQTIRLMFSIEEDSNIEKYRIKYSEDGLNFREVDLLFPNGITGKKVYSVELKIPQ